MAWAEAVPAILVAALALLWPAPALVVALRLPPLAAMAIAAPVGILVLVTSAAAAGFAGQPWGWPWVAGLAAILVVGLVAARRLAHRNRIAADLPAGHRSPRILAPYLAGMAIATGLVGGSVLDALGGPLTFAQRYDNVFHLNAIHLASMGHASSFDLSPLTHNFYPAAWHDWAAFVVQVAGADVRTATHAGTLVVAFLVWPLGLAWFVETVLSPGMAGRLAVGPLALASVSFPLTLAGWGPLYPNMLGLALVPVVLAAGWDLLDRRETPALGLGSGLTVAVLAGAAVALSHPNAALSAGLVLWPIAIVALVGVARSRGRAPLRGSRLWTLAVAGFVVVFPVAWVVMGNSIAAGSIRWPFTTPDVALAEVLTGTSLLHPAVPVLTIGLVAGLVVLCFVPRLRVLLAPFALVGVAYVGAAALETSPGVLLFTAPYYSDPYRIAAVLALLTVPFAVLGWDRVATLLTDRLPTRAATVLGVVLAVGLATTATASGGLRMLYGELRADYSVPADARILNPDELALIERLPTTTQPDDVLVVNAWQGGALAYAFADRRVTDWYMNTPPSEAAQYLHDHLNEVATDPAVCAALAETGARYALVLDPFEIPGPADREPTHLGLRGLDTAPGFERVDAEGTSALYLITACG